MKSFGYLGILFLICVLGQVLILNQLYFLGVGNPYLYILFLFAMPLTMSRFDRFTMAFLLGFAIDLFSGTPGLHSFSCVFAQFVAMESIFLFVPKDDKFKRDSLPLSIKSMGVSSFMKLATLVVLCHHGSLFLLEAFSVQHLGLLIVRILVSATLTLFLLYVVEKNKK